MAKYNAVENTESNITTPFVAKKVVRESQGVKISFKIAGEKYNINGKEVVSKEGITVGAGKLAVNLSPIEYKAILYTKEDPDLMAELAARVADQIQKQKDIQAY